MDSRGERARLRGAGSGGQRSPPFDPAKRRSRLPVTPERTDPNQEAVVNFPRGISGAALAATLQLASLSAPSAQTQVPPGHDEVRQRERREAWLNSIHRAAPGTDWRMIEA